MQGRAMQLCISPTINSEIEKLQMSREKLFREVQARQCFFDMELKSSLSLFQDMHSLYNQDRTATGYKTRIYKSKQQKIHLRAQSTKRCQHLVYKL